MSASSSDEVTNNIYNSNGQLAYTLDANLRLTEYDYDASGNLIQTIAYAGDVTAASSYTLAYIQSQISSLGLASVSGDRTTRYVYDADDRLAYSIDAMGDVAGYGYDAAGQLSKEDQYATLYTASGAPTLAAMQSWASTNATSTDRVTRTVYDAAGRVAFSVDADGYVTGYAYSAQGEVTTQTRYAATYSVSDGVTQASLATLIGSASGSEVTSYAYDNSGRLVSTTDPLGIVTQLTLNAAGQVATSTVAYGTSDAATTAYAYDALGRVTSVTTASGQSEAATTSYTYDGLGRVLTSIDGNNNTTTYTYNASGQVLTTKDPLGAVTTNVYNAFGNLVETTDPNGHSGFFYYDLLNRLTLQVDPDGYATATTYTIGNQVASVTRYHLATTGAPTTTTPPTVNTSSADETTTFTRDLDDRLKQETDATGATQIYAYDAFGDQISDTNQLGGTTTYTYDGRGLMTSETLPITSTTAGGTTEATQVTTTYAYDGFGNRTAMVQAAGLTEQQTTAYTYDLDNRLTSQTVHPGGLNLVTSYSYDRRGNLIEEIDPDLNQTFYYYDHRNNKIAEVNAVGALTTWSYDGVGNVLSQTVYGSLVGLPTTAGGAAPTPVNPSNYRQTTYAYDGDNRRTTTTIVSTSTNAIISGAESGSTYTAATGAIATTTVYDKDGNVIQTIDGDGNSTYYYYDAAGRKIGQVDPLGYLTTYALDQDGNVLTEQQYALAASVSGGITASTTLAMILADTSSSVAYGSSGAIISVNLSGGAATSITISTPAGHGTASVSGTTVSYTPGSTYSGTDSFGYTVTYANGSTYTGAASIVVNPPAVATVAAPTDRITTFTYDKDGRRLTETRLNVAYASISSTSGAMTQSTGNATITYTYNGLGEVLTQTEATGDETTYAYDSEGRLISTATPSYTDASGATDQPQTLEYYDGLGDLTETVVGNGGRGNPRVTSYTYSAAGRLTSTTNADGFTETYTDDADGNVLSVTYGRVTSSGAVTPEEIVYQYDKLGRMVSQTTADESGTTWTFGDTTNVEYDAYGEVVGKGVNGDYQANFAYDGAGRLISSNSGNGSTVFYSTTPTATRRWRSPRLGPAR